LKKLILLTILIFCVNAYGQQWTLVTQIPGGPRINSISVVNQNLIWVCCDTTKIFRSTNAGLNWELRNGGIPSGNLYGISAIDSLNCWVGTVLGSIYRTTNGGLNWTQQFSQSGSFSNCIKMFNLNYGIYNGDPSGNGQPMQYRYTTNGGLNWILSPNAPISNNEYSLVNAWDWIDTGNVWIGVANAVTNATNTKVNRTSVGFGGGVWNTGVFLGTGTSDGLYAQGIGFTNLQNGMVGTNNSAIRKTTNGGVNWSIVTAPSGLVSFNISDMESFKDGSNTIRFAIGTLTTNYIYKTTDYGVTWVNEPLPTLGTANRCGQMEFVNPSLGYAGCASGVFLKYTGPSSINDPINSNAGDYILNQNFPNPFNPSTVIKFYVPAFSRVSLKIYDVMGREVYTILDEEKSSGEYSYQFNAPENMGAGVYYYTLQSDKFTETKKLLLLK